MNDPSGTGPHPRHGRFSARIPDEPRAGFFAYRLVKGGPFVPARIIVDFELFQLLIDGAQVGQAVDDPLRHRELMKVWEFGKEIDQREYEALLAAKATRPDARKPLDLARSPSLF